MDIDEIFKPFIKNNEEVIKNYEKIKTESDLLRKSALDSFEEKKERFLANKKVKDQEFKFLRSK